MYRTSMTQAEIDNAIQDQLGIDPFAPLPSNTMIAEALASSATESVNVAVSLNQNLQQIYLTGFQNWSQQVLAGRVPNTNPPQPPVGYLAVRATDGWSFVIRGT